MQTNQFSATYKTCPSRLCLCSVCGYRKEAQLLHFATSKRPHCKNEWGIDRKAAIDIRKHILSALLYILFATMELYKFLQQLSALCGAEIWTLPRTFLLKMTKKAHAITLILLIWRGIFLLQCVIIALV
jgi:hypothetical protein